MVGSDKTPTRATATVAEHSPVEAARIAHNDAATVLMESENRRDALYDEYRVAVLAHDGDAMERITHALGGMEQHILAGKIAVPAARLIHMDAQIEEATRHVAVAYGDAETKRQAIITITEEVHPSERATMGGDPDRMRRYRAAMEINGQANAAHTMAQEHLIGLRQQRQHANGDLVQLIERVAARIRRDTTP